MAHRWPHTNGLDGYYYYPHKNNVVFVIRDNTVVDPRSPDRSAMQYDVFMLLGHRATVYKHDFQKHVFSSNDFIDCKHIIDDVTRQVSELVDQITVRLA